jgi:hypothetical protein
LRCAELIKAAGAQKSFVGTKCSVAKADGQVTTADVLAAQAELLGKIDV